jgi:competence protein ComEC
MTPLKLHFLNVGHGDCTIIDFPSGHLTMVDINNSRTLDDDSEQELENEIAKRQGVGDLSVYRLLGSLPQSVSDSMTKYREEFLTDPVDYFLQHFGRDRHIFRYIQTHPDMDHMTGLYRLREEGIEIVNFWDTKHSVEKSDDPADWKETQYDIRDWQTYNSLRGSTSDPKALFYVTGDQHEYFKDDGIRIWAPFKHNEDIDEDDDINSLSYVLRIEYGSCNILLGGDAPVDYWETVYNSPKFAYPKIHLLKTPHHGRKSGYHWQSVKAMNPDCTVVSVGKLAKKDDAFASYEKWSNKGCYSTRFEGNITATCWPDGDVWLYDQNGNRL